MNYLMVVVWLRNVLHSLGHLHAWSPVGGSACLVQSYWKKDIWRTDFEMQNLFPLVIQSLLPACSWGCDLSLCFYYAPSSLCKLILVLVFYLSNRKAMDTMICYCCVAIFTKLKYPLLEGDQQDPRSQWNLQGSKRLHGSDRIHESAPTMLYK